MSESFSVDVANHINLGPFNSCKDVVLGKSVVEYEGGSFDQMGVTDNRFCCGIIKTNTENNFFTIEPRTISIAMRGSKDSRKDVRRAVNKLSSVILRSIYSLIEYFEVHNDKLPNYVTVVFSKDITIEPSCGQLHVSVDVGIFVALEVSVDRYIF